MRKPVGCSALIASIMLTTTAAAGDITIRTYLSDDTLLRIGPYAFEAARL